MRIRNRYAYFLSFNVAVRNDIATTTTKYSRPSWGSRDTSTGKRQNAQKVSISGAWVRCFNLRFYEVRRRNAKSRKMGNIKGGLEFTIYLPGGSRVALAIPPLRPSLWILPSRLRSLVDCSSIARFCAALDFPRSLFNKSLGTTRRASSIFRLLVSAETHRHWFDK